MPMIHTPSLKPVANPRMSLYVGDLDPSVTESDLNYVFSSMGPILSLRLCRCSSTGRSLCYGYVNFYSAFDANKALCNLNHMYLKGKPMRLMWSQRDPSVRRSSSANLYVKNLDSSIDSAALHNLFSQFGTILSCKVVEHNGVSKGFGFVQFSSEDSALAALSALHDTVLKDKKLYVSRFVKKNERTATTSCDELKFTNLYVKNLPASVSQDSLNTMFSAFGEVSNAVIMKDHNGNSRGFGFVNFKSPEDAKAAIDALNGYEIDSKTLFVARAQKKAERLKILRHEYKDAFKNRMEKFKTSNLYVKNLPDCVEDDKLQELFKPFGKIVSSKVMRSSSGESKGFGFVRFSSSEEAEKALNSLNGSMFEGKSLYVALAQCKRDRQMDQQKRFAQYRSQPTYLSGSTLAPYQIRPFYETFYPYSQGGPILQHTFPYEYFGGNMGNQHPKSYTQNFCAYQMPMGQMHQSSQTPTVQSYQLPLATLKHATFNLSSRDLNSRNQILSYKSRTKNIGGAVGTAHKFKKVARNILYPHVENIKPDSSGNIAGGLSQMSNLNSENSLRLQADREPQVLKEVNILKTADAAAAALPKTATRFLE